MGELVAAAVFGGVGGLIAAPRFARSVELTAFWCALGPLLFLLVQAGAYWLMARRWVGRTGMPSSVATAYRALKVINAGVLAASLVAVIVLLPASGAIALGVLAVWMFGVIEYVNYFVRRLAYPPRRWFRAVRRRKRPQLVQDLQAAR